MTSDLSAILPLVGGFWIVLRCELLYLVSLQLSQAITLLLSAFLACVVAIVSRSVIWLLIGLHWNAPFERLSTQVWPLPFSGTALGAFLLAVLVAEASRFALKTRRINAWVVRNFAGEMIKLLRESMLAIKPVALTLNNRKVYIGFVQGLPNLDPNNAFVRLLPVLSGYRDEKTLSLRITTYYAESLRSAAERRAIEDFVKVIPLSSVQVAGLFDTVVYGEFFAPKQPPLVQSA